MKRKTGDSGIGPSKTGNRDLGDDPVHGIGATIPFEVWSEVASALGPAGELRVLDAGAAAGRGS